MGDVAVLCAARNSVYHQMLGLDVYDASRGARSFQGGMPVVAHPPCRSWSAYCAHQAKPAEGERDLALWCVEQVRTWGGVLEQPAHSRLWEAAGIPRPGIRQPVGAPFSVCVWQAWWGYPMRKSTWLYFVNVAPSDVQPPLLLHAPGADRRREQVMSKNQRAATTPAFAEWLVAIARRAHGQ